jgi:hypothetical protein
MSTKKKKKASTTAEPKPPETLYDRDVCAPDDIDISTHTQNLSELARWYPGFSLYVRSMRAVGRAVLVREYADNLSFSSVPEDMR